MQTRYLQSKWARDDSLIKAVSVRTDRLLAPTNPSHVKLVIRVVAQVSMSFGAVSLYAE